MPDLQFKATINGRKISRTARPHQRLLDFIRDDLNLTGNKEGCGAGECGTCSVFVDGVLMKSCLVPVAKAQGTIIETVESLAQTGALAVLSEEANRGKIALFAGIEKARFKRQVLPGDTLELEMVLTRRRGPIGEGEGVATVDGEVACQAVLRFAIIEGES